LFEEDRETLFLQIHRDGDMSFGETN
jgi:hypothetical protein